MFRPAGFGGGDARPSKAEVEAAARTLLRWAGDGSTEIGAADITALLAGAGAPYPSLDRRYARDFVADAAYRATLPDLQNGPESLIKGARAGIQHVGISNFRLPVRFRTREGGEVQLETSVTGSVSLEADRKGINMSRIMRSFYRHAETQFSFEVIGAVLDSYLADLDSYDARIMMRLRYPMLKRALRSGLEGYQYYDVALEMAKTAGATRRIVHLDYIYPRPARARSSSPSTPGAPATRSRARIRSARWRGCRSSSPAALCSGSRTSSTSATPRSPRRPR